MIWGHDVQAGGEVRKNAANSGRYAMLIGRGWLHRQLAPGRFDLENA
jgi:hypothetical protein